MSWLVVLKFLKRHWLSIALVLTFLGAGVWLNNYLDDRDAVNQNVGFDDAVTKTNDAVVDVKKEIKKHVDETSKVVSELDCTAVNYQLFKSVEGYKSVDKSKVGDCSGGDLPRGDGAEDVTRTYNGHISYQDVELETQEGVSRIRAKQSVSTDELPETKGCEEEDKGYLMAAYPEFVWECEYFTNADGSIGDAVSWRGFYK